jgi:CheY-like chemotaxis protein
MARILVMEDERGLRLAIRKQLEVAGHTVIEAENGAQGVTAFMESGADLVITDILMPDKEGIQAIIEIKQQRPDAPVVAMSGGGRRRNMQYLEFARTLGVRHILEKPFRRSDLMTAVTESLAN